MCPSGPSPSPEPGPPGRLWNRSWKSCASSPRAEIRKFDPAIACLSITLLLCPAGASIIPVCHPPRRTVRNSMLHAILAWGFFLPPCSVAFQAAMTPSLGACFLCGSTGFAGSGGSLPPLDILGELPYFFPRMPIDDKERVEFPQGPLDI